MGNHTTGFSHLTVKMGRTLCFVLLLSASVYLGSADKCDDKYPECKILAADGGCVKDFVKKDCPTSCRAEGCVKNVLKDNFYGALPGKGQCTIKSVSTAIAPSDQCKEYPGECPGMNCDETNHIPPECHEPCPKMCEWAVKNGKCHNATDDFWYRTCPKSCENPICNECTNVCPECIKWAEEGECGREYVFEKCRLACDVRCNSTCTDTCHEACESWGKEGRCDDPWVLEQCQLTCNKDCWTTLKPTPTPTTTPTTTTVDCTDECIPACKDWYADKSWDMCANKRFADVCPAECDPRCKTHPTTEGPVPDGTCDELCTDSMGQFMIPGAPTKWCHCSNWLGYVKDCAACDKNQGHPLCDKYGALVFDDSTRQCDWPEIACKSRSDCPYTAVIAAVEKREYADCKFWAANGDCYDPAKHTQNACGTCDWQKWVAKNCPVACAGNPVPPTPPVPVRSCPCHGQQYGQFPVRGECTKWCHCSNYMGVVKDCPDCDRLSGHPLCAKYGHTLFDQSIGQCDWPEKVIAKRRDC